jgi:hypothetical protein
VKETTDKNMFCISSAVKGSRCLKGLSSNKPLSFFALSTAAQSHQTAQNATTSRTLDEAIPK